MLTGWFCPYVLIIVIGLSYRTGQSLELGTIMIVINVLIGGFSLEDLK